jgi:phage gp36-like protein
MSSYATTTDFEQLGLPAAATADVDPDALAAALAAASSRADGYLAGRFTLPLTAWGSDLTEAVCALAAWAVLSARGFDPEGGADSAVRKRYEDAVRWLEQVSSGKVNPRVTDSSTGGLSAAPAVCSQTRRGW